MNPSSNLATDDEVSSLIGWFTRILPGDSYKQLLTSNPSWHGRSLRECEDAFLSYVQTRDLIIRSPLKALDKKTITSIISELDNLHITLSDIDVSFKHDPSSGELEDGCDQAQRTRCDIIRVSILKIKDLCEPIIRSYVYRDFEEQKQKLADLVRLAQEDRKRILEVRESVESHAQDMAVKEYAKHFEPQEDDLRKASIRWLLATALAALSTLGAMIFLFNYQIESGLPQENLVVFLVSKIVMFGFMIAATVWAGRNYRGTKQLLAETTHRVNSLKTFEIFVKSADSPEVRRAVLLETSRAIFRNRHTPYSGGDFPAYNPTDALSAAFDSSKKEKS